MRLRDLKLNPLGVLGGALTITSTLLPWMTLSAFGYVANSDLWQISSSDTSFPIAQNVASAALVSGVLLIIGGLVATKRAKLGLPISAAALAIFGVESYSTFGMFPSVIPVSILPGLGIFTALSGIILGAASLRTRETKIGDLLVHLRTPTNLGLTGILVTSGFLSADGWNHWSTGQFQGFFGTTLLEGVIHRLFFIGVGAILLVFLIQRSMFVQRAGGYLVVATFSALVLDLVYHLATGNIVSFVGHDAVEVLLHLVTYYGMASILAARMFLKQVRPT